MKMNIPIVETSKRRVMRNCRTAWLLGACLAGSIEVEAGLPIIGGLVGSESLLRTGGATSSTNRAPEVISKTTGQVAPNGTVLLAWTGDDILDDGKANSDFLTVIDAEPDSTTYGKVIWTAGLPSVLGANKPGTALGHTSDVHNEPHHNNAYTTYIDPVSHKKYLFAGGLISGNVFRYDITDVRRIPPAEIAICGTELLKSSLTDDFAVLPNGHIAVTYMGGVGYYGPGTVTEFAPLRKGLCVGGLPWLPLVPAALQDPKQYLSENSAIVWNSGIKRYTPQHVTNITDAGLEAYPHGMQLTYDGKYLVTSDYANPLVLGAGDPIANLFNETFAYNPLPTDSTSLRQFGTTVRVWKANALKDGPISISQVPDGPRIEDIYMHEEPEGLMGFAAPHTPGHTDPATGTFVPHQGAFTASMCGGTLYYTSNILAPQTANNGQGPEWKAVYDVGPCTGVSYFTISDDDKYLFLPIAGENSPGDHVYERDYPGEHDRRVLSLAIRPLLNKGAGPINCDFPPADPSRAGNTSLGLPKAGDPLNDLVHNNGADDCPVVVGQLLNNSPENYATHGGAHYTGVDRAGASSLAPGKRLVFIDYFVDLNHMGLLGTGSGGDRKIYVAKINSDGSLQYDTDFRDELTGELGVALTSPARSVYSWPNRGVTGSGRPHGAIFEKNGLILKGPDSYR